MAINNDTLKKALLSELARGIATTKILPVTNGEVTLSALDFSSAGLIFSIEDSYELDWAEPTLDEIRIDQGEQTIAIDVDKGDISFSANYPTSAEAALKEFFKSGKECTVTSETGVTYKGTSIFTEPLTTEVSMLTEDQNKAFCVTFARIALTARLAYDAERKVWYIGLNGRVLANLKEGEGDVLVGKRSTSGE